jgi:hypothetical protein
VHRDSELILDLELIICDVNCEYHSWYFISFRNVTEWLHSCRKTDDLVSKVFILSNMSIPGCCKGSIKQMPHFYSTILILRFLISSFGVT